MSDIGDRVGVIYSNTGDAIKFLGEGVYEGKHPVPNKPKMEMVFSEITDFKALHPADHAQIRNSYADLISKPRIRLENGDHVWGHECYIWGPIRRIKSYLIGHRVHNVRLTRNEKGEVNGFIYA